jgi:hypothetical protein
MFEIFNEIASPIESIENLKNISTQAQYFKVQKQVSPMPTRVASHTHALCAKLE